MKEIMKLVDEIQNGIVFNDISDKEIAKKMVQLRNEGYVEPYTRESIINQMKIRGVIWINM